MNKLLKECMPGSYIEGFKEIFQILEKSNLQKKLKIFTQAIYLLTVYLNFGRQIK